MYHQWEKEGDALGLLSLGFLDGVLQPPGPSKEFPQLESSAHGFKDCKVHHSKMFFLFTDKKAKKIGSTNGRTIHTMGFLAEIPEQAMGNLVCEHEMKKL